MSTSRVMFVVDAGYYTATQKQIGSIDLLKLKMYVSKHIGTIVRSYYVTCYNTEEQRSFHNWVKTVPKLELIIKGQKEKHCDACGKTYFVEKALDVGMSVLAIKHASKYDVLVMVNGDGDMLDAYQHLKDDLGKQVVILGELNSISPDIHPITDLVILSDIYKDIAK